MLLRLFKVTSSFLLIALLSFLASKRDLIFTQHTTQKTPPSSLDTKEVPQETLEALPPPATTTQKNVTQQPPSKEKTPPSAVTKSEPYAHQTEGASDTDEGYRPQISPCTSPMGYRIGTFDTRFGISRTMFLQEIKQAADTWGDAVGKTLFYYDETGPLTINLIYDDRQARTEDINYLTMEIENAKQSADQIKAFYEQEKEMYTKDSEQLTKDNDAFQLRYKAYSEKVATYNAAGGASRPEYDAMMNELATLKQEAKSLDDRRASLLITMESVNKKVARYNELVTYINTLVKRSNALGAKKFTEGKFSSGPNTIDIYQYSDSTKLRRVVTHELGHALGISYHTKNIYSIMYSVNSATTTILSKEDLEALNDVCPFQ